MKKMLLFFCLLLLANMGIPSSPWAEENPFFDAIIKGDLKTVQDFLAKGVDVNAPLVVKGVKLYPLNAAMTRGNVEIVKLFIEKGGDVNRVTNESKITILMIAAESKPGEIIRMLLDKGAKINAVNDQNSTALHGGAYKGNLEAVKVLLDRGVDTKVINFKGTALHMAALGNQPKMIEMLLEKGFDINQPGKNGLTPLMVAAASNKVDAVKMLLKKNADITIKSPKTALALATEEKAKEVINLLTAAGAKE